MEKQSALDEVLERHDYRGMGAEFDQMVMQPYKARNSEELIQEKPGMSEAELIQRMQQLDPVVVDPNWIADMQQRLVKVDADMKAVDPAFSVYTNPKTKRLANWLARESGPATPGYFKSGEQAVEQQQGGALMAAAEGVADFGLSILFNGVDLAGKAIGSIMGESYGVPWAVATNYVEDENGNLINNGGKVPGIVDVIASINARILGENVHEYVARVREARNLEHLNASGFQRLVRGTAGILGMAGGFGLPAGAAMHAGQAAMIGGRIGGGSAGIGKFAFTAPSIELPGLATKGLMKMATMGASPRIVKLTKVLAGTAGAAVNNGLAEGLAFGREEGYGKAFVHGMAMAPVMMAFGAMGRKSESLFARKKMPAAMARTISGALEGAGFGTLEAAQVGALWNLMKDPSLDTWEIYAKNMLGFGIFKGAFGRSVVPTPEFGEAQARQMFRQRGREGLAEEVSRADEAELMRTADERIQEEMAREREMVARESSESEQGPEAPYESLEARGGTQQVEGREPTLPEGQREQYQVKGRLPSPEKQLEQAQRGELQEGEMVKTEEVLAQRTKKADDQGPDPLEEPDFAQRPPEQQKAILERRTAKERRQVAESFEGPERRSGERRGAAPPEVGPRLSAQELAREVQRLRAQGPSPENRRRITELLQQERGRLTEGAGEAYRQIGEEVRRSQTGEKAPVTETRRIRESAADLEARVEKSGVPREILRELGDISRARRAARSPEEAAELFRRQLEIEQELDALEMAQDPVMNATMRQALRELEVKELDTSEGDIDAAAKAGEVNPIYGERYGAESMRKEANPYRQQENLLEPGEKPVRASDIIAVLKGRPGFPGVRILGRRLGRIEGSAVQVAIRAGRIRSAGVFKIFENLTRTEEGMDLVVALHEWGHAMQRQVAVGKGGVPFVDAVRKWLQGQSSEVLSDMATILRSYPGANKLPLWRVGAEAWAEWHARNLLGDPTLRAEVPHLSLKMDSWLYNTPELLPQYREIMELADIYKRQGALERLNQSIRRGAARPQGKLIERVLGRGEEVWDSIVKNFFDDMILLKKSQARWLELSDIEAVTLSIQEDPARLYDVLYMKAGKQAESFIMRGTHNLALERTGESLFDIINDVGKDLKGRAKNEKTIDFINYVVATRAIDLIEKGKKQTLPLSDYLEAKKRLIAANPDFAGVAKRLKVWTDALLDLVAEAGNIPQKDVQRMKDYSVAYLPFERALEGTVTKRGPRGVAEKGNAIKAFKGDTREIQDPMQAMFETTTMMIAKAHQQMVMKAMYKMMLRADVGGLATRVPRKNVPSRFRYDQVIRQLDKTLNNSEFMRDLSERAANGDAEAMEMMEMLRESMDMLGELAKSGELSEDTVTLFGQKMLPIGEGANLVAYMPRLSSAEIESLPSHSQVNARKWNNQMQWLELDPDAYTALTQIDHPISPAWLDNAIVKALLIKPGRVLKFFATDANPPFVAANAIRDMASAPVFDREGKIHTFRIWSGVGRFIQGGAILLGTKDRVIADMYNASGSRVASLYDEGIRREIRGQVSNMRERVAEPFLKAAKKWTDWMAQPESFIRVHEFKRVYEKALADGKSKVDAVLEAMEGAQEITTNFSRAGTIARVWNQMTPYFSASLAGQRKLLRAITGMEGRTDQERGRMQAAALFNGVQNITIPSMVAWAMVHDEDWYKDLPIWRKQHFLNFKMPGSETIVSLPLPFELGTLFGSLPQMVADEITDSNPIPFFETMAESMFPYLRGVGALLPAAVKPILEVSSGNDFFLGRELTPYYIEQNNPPAEQIRPGTPTSTQEVFKILQNVGVEWFLDNPIELEQLLAGYTAGASTSFMRWVDETLSLKDHPGMRPGIEAAYGVFLNRFARQTVHGTSRTVDEFYNKLAPEIEQRARHEKTRTPELRRSLRQITRDKDRMSDIRRQVRAGEISKAEGDRMIYEIARKALDRENR